MKTLGPGSKLSYYKKEKYKYNGFTVEQIIDKGVPYYPLLAEIYFNKVDIGLRADLLKKVRIYDEFILVKPSAAPELYDVWLERVFTEEEKLEIAERESWDKGVNLLKYTKPAYYTGAINKDFRRNQNQNKIKKW